MTDHWNDNLVQFARLLWELQGVDAFTKEVMEGLTTSMDLGEDEIWEVVFRAGKVYDQTVAQLP